MQKENFGIKSKYMLEEKLKEYFGFTGFRPGQKEVMESILDGNDTLAIMPTGAGKSLCFQFPAVMFSGLTVVISPLIALMKNQVDSLSAMGIESTFINSSLDIEEQRQRYRELVAGKYKLLYLAPESLAKHKFLEAIARLKVDLLAVDEAHCISSWGHDFRPEYQKISNYVTAFEKRPIVAAFTATATPLVSDDIKRRLGLKSPKVFIRSFDRPNLKLFVRVKVPLKQRRKEALRLIQSIEGGGIIYTLTIKEAEDAAAYLKDKGIKAAAYHAKLDKEKRKKIQDEFMENQYKVVVATVAFGMGIDKADIRFVIHIGMPPNLERYYQEAGRAGRDGETAYCILLHNGRDKATQHYFIQNSIEQMREQRKSEEEVRLRVNTQYRQLEAIENYVMTETCRRKMLLDYFKDPQAKNISNCKGCDNCMDFKWSPTSSRLRGAEEKKKYWAEEKDDLSGTILQSVELYKSGHSVEQIAKIRGLGRNTIMGHLAQWLAVGGDFRILDYVSKEQEELILAAVKKVGAERLSPIKEILPDSIGYEEIKLVLAKMEKEKRK